MPRDAEPEQPDIEMSARVRARELTFRERPHVDVRFPGGDPQRSGQRTRRNVPSPVEPGVTYRDVRVLTRITSALRALRGRQ